MNEVLMHDKNKDPEILITFSFLGWDNGCPVHQVLLTVELFERNEARRAQDCDLWLLVEWIIQNERDVDLLSNLARKEDLGATVDSHGIWVEAKVLILIEVKEANECLVLIQLQDVLLGVLMVLLIHDRYFVDS